MQNVTIGAAAFRALPISFAGEIGWELHVRSEFACDVYNRLMEAGAPKGLRNVGYRALDSLRNRERLSLLGVGHHTDYNPFEAGLGFCVDLERAPFLAQAALQRVKAEGPSRRLVTFYADSLENAFGGEAVRMARSSAQRRAQRLRIRSARLS